MKRLKALSYESFRRLQLRISVQTSAKTAVIDRRRTLPASLRCLHNPEYAEESIWVRLRCRYWRGSCFRATHEQSSHQQLPAEERAHTSVPCHLCRFTVDVRWRQTYFQTSLLRECHQATCLAHLRTRLNRGKLLNRSPSLFTEFSHRQAALAKSCECPRWCTKNQPPSLHSHICLLDIVPRAVDVCSKSTLRMSLCGVCVCRGECTLHEMWSQTFLSVPPRLGGGLEPHAPIQVKSDRFTSPVISMLRGTSEDQDQW